MSNEPEQATQTNLPAQLEKIARRFEVRDIYVFGSRAREIASRVHGEQPSRVLSGSDVDIAVQPERGVRLSVEQKVRLAIALEDLFDVGRVDLVTVPEADPFLATDIVRGELLYCGDPDEQAETELYILRRAADLAHFKKERIDSILS